MKMTLVRNVKSPTRGTNGSCGLDFYIPDDFNLGMAKNIYPGESILIASGVKVELPKNTALIAHNKSGIAKKGLLVGASVVDEDYEGEIHINLWNVSTIPIKIHPGYKIVQFILMPILYEPLELVLESEMYLNSKSERKDGAFGSTNDLGIKPINITHSEYDGI